MICRILFLLYVSLFLHETGHMIAIALTRSASIDRFRITPLGFNVQLNLIQTSYVGKLYVYFAGPLINLIMFCFFYSIEFYTMATINAFLCFINLLPIVPLDGGNIVKAVICNFSNEFTASICSIIIAIVFILFSIYCFYLSKSIIYILFIVMALKGIIQEKTSLSEYKIKDIYKKLRL